MAGKNIEILPEDVLGGLDAVISTFVHNPAFHSQAKTKLTNNAVGDAIYNALVKEFNKFINGLSEDQTKAIKTKIVNNARIRTAAEVAKATKKKSVAIKNPANLPSNLSDCKYAGVDVENSELYIAEGLSASGTILAARNSNYQGVLPVRGKILNVMKLDFSNKKQRERFVNNAEIDDIIKALGAGVGDNFDIDKARYGKVVFAADQDVDGCAINVLLLGVFYKLFRPMIEQGRVYQCVSPFYEFRYKDKGKDHFEYAIDEKDRMQIEKRLKSKNVKYSMGRAKGLGELNADVFHDVVLNPENRKLIKITIEDAKKADEMMNLSIGMGSADSRKEWMLDHTEVIDDLGLYS